MTISSFTEITQGETQGEPEQNPGWLSHVWATPHLGLPLEETLLWLQDRLAPHPDAARCLPRIVRLDCLTTEALSKRLGRTPAELFRVAPTTNVDAATLPDPEHGDLWTLLLREGLESEDEVAFLEHVFLLRALGHLAPGDPHGHWDRLEDLTAPTRRWDREVAEMLGPEVSPASRPVNSWAVANFLRDVPFLDPRVPFAPDLLPFQPWPHQIHVASEILSRFPERFLLCDEVGLGKTIETGMALRELVHRGIVRRCLLLVPKGVQSQWREEMGEKFNLNFRTFGDTGQHGWDGNPALILASSHLVRRKARIEELLAAEPWDLVILDEAHHARRNGEGRPNRRRDRPAVATALRPGSVPARAQPSRGEHDRWQGLGWLRPKPARVPPASPAATHSAAGVHVPQHAGTSASLSRNGDGPGPHPPAQPGRPVHCARSSGTSEHPMSSACRKTLDAILEICHQMTNSSQIRAEWKKHRSVYALKWYTSILARKKILGPNTPQAGSWRESIGALGLSGNEREALEKDTLLIDAALASDRIIISADDIARNLYCRLSAREKLLRDITWVNPVGRVDEVLDWMKEGAPPRPQWQLGDELPGPRKPRSSPKSSRKR